MDNVAIFGCGGLGQLTRDILLQAGQYNPVCYLDSDARKHGLPVDGLPVIGGMERISDLTHDGVAGAIVAIGDNGTRVRIAAEIESAGMRLIAAVHPLASISATASVGRHVIIGPRAIVCVNARVGPHSILSAGAIADHDTAIGQGVHIYPAVRLAGGVQIEDFATLEIGASVIPYRRVGRRAFVHAGAVVIRDVPPDYAVSGVPARTVACGAEGPIMQLTGVAAAPLPAVQ